jgi:hypothetical protein
MGYSAVTIRDAAKTLSMNVGLLEAAQRHGASRFWRRFGGDTDTDRPEQERKTYVL